MTHINDHITYPATKEEIIAACQDMSDASDEEKKMVADKLPAGTYNDAGEVKMALGM